MEIMEGVHLHLLLLLVTLIQGIQGQAITPSKVDIAVEDDVSLECRTATTVAVFAFSWFHGTTQIYTGGIKSRPADEYVNFELDENTDAKISILIINGILRQDAGEYRCTVTGIDDMASVPVTVEVGSPPPLDLIALKSIDADSSSMYQATCDAIGSSPAENITWILDGVTVTETAGIVETDPQESEDDTLFDKRSVFTFPATTDNYEKPLQCNISGHQVAKLNRQETRLLDIHKRPQPNGIIIGFTSSEGDLTVSCDVNDAVDAAKPAMSTFFIYSNGTLIDKPLSDNSFTDTEPEQDTEFTCVGGNYLDNATTTRTFEPGSTTTPPPVTEPITPEGTTTKSPGLSTTEPSTTSIDPSKEPKVGGLSTGAVAGIAVGCILCVVIIVVIVLFLLKPECCPCFAGSGTPAPSNKPSGRAVGSSNGSGSEKDVESPLNGVKDVTAQEKLPQAAPRGHGSIQHTNDNPDQAMYAMVDKKPARGGGGGAGDAPDRGSGPGQNEPQGMLYADLDLSHKAGHTDKHVPKNENDVVVYSSILV